VRLADVVEVRVEMQYRAAGAPVAKARPRRDALDRTRMQSELP